MDRQHVILFVSSHQINGIDLFYIFRRALLEEAMHLQSIFRIQRILQISIRLIIGVAVISFVIRIGLLILFRAASGQRQRYRQQHQDRHYACYFFHHLPPLFILLQLFRRTVILQIQDHQHYQNDPDHTKHTDAGGVPSIKILKSGK